eukprot:SAG31_NODE_2151_length_6325_cov_2.165275_1_plen_80_part_00
MGHGLIGYGNLYGRKELAVRDTRTDVLNLVRARPIGVSDGGGAGLRPRFRLFIDIRYLHSTARRRFATDRTSDRFGKYV